MPIKGGVNVVVYIKNKYQCHKLNNNVLKVYDSENSALVNMENNGYSKIYDCGNFKFEWNK